MKVNARFCVRVSNVLEWKDEEPKKNLDISLISSKTRHLFPSQAEHFPKKVKVQSELSHQSPSWLSRLGFFCFCLSLSCGVTIMSPVTASLLVLYPLRHLFDHQGHAPYHHPLFSLGCSGHGVHVSLRYWPTTALSDSMTHNRYASPTCVAQESLIQGVNWGKSEVAVYLAQGLLLLTVGESKMSDFKAIAGYRRTSVWRRDRYLGLEKTLPPCSRNVALITGAIFGLSCREAQ